MNMESNLATTFASLQTLRKVLPLQCLVMVSVISCATASLGQDSNLQSKQSQFDVSVSNLKIVDQDLPEIRYECVITNNGSQTLLASEVFVFGSLAEDASDGNRTPLMSGLRLRGAEKLAPGESCRGIYWGVLKSGVYHDLIVEAKILKRHDANPQDNTARLDIRKLVQQVEEPIPFDIALTSLEITQRGNDHLRFRYTLKNVGKSAIDASWVLLQADLSTESSLNADSRKVGSWTAGGCDSIPTGSVCTLQYSVPIVAGDFTHLVLEARGRRVSDLNPDNNVLAISLDAPIVEPPKKMSPDADTSKETTTAKATKASEANHRKSTGPPLSVWICFGSFMLLLFSSFGLLIYVMVAAARSNKRFLSSRFKRDESGAPADPNAVRNVAERLGFRLLERPPQKLRVAISTALGADELTDVMVRQSNGGAYYLCNLEIEIWHTRSARSRSADSVDFHRSWTEIRRLTLLVFLSDDARFPPFNVTPWWGKQIRLMKWLGSSYVNNVQIDHDPEFHEKISLSTFVPEAVEPMLSEDLRSEFKANSELTTVVRRKSIIIYDDNQKLHYGIRHHGTHVTSHPLDLSEWPNFAQAAVPIIRNLRIAEQETRDARPSSAEVARQVSSHRDGPGLGSVLSDDLDAFLQHPPPRPIPKYLWQASKNKIDFWLQLVGFFFCFMSTLFLTIVWGTGVADDRLLASVPMLLAILIGAPLFTIPFLRKWRTKSLLRSGKVASAYVTNVERTSTQIIVGHARFRRYRTTFVYSLHGKKFQAVRRTYSDQTQRATALLDSEEITRVLVNPTTPEQIFWIDGLRAD